MGWKKADTRQVSVEAVIAHSIRKQGGKPCEGCGLAAGTTRGKVSCDWLCQECAQRELSW